MKRYLLLPSQRRDLLQQGGHLLEAPLGASGIESLLQASARTVSDGSLQRSELCFMASPLVVACHLSCCANWLSALSLSPSCLQDRSFVCLHYHLDSQGTLHPVDISPTASTGNCCNGCTAERHTVEQSNVQLGMMVRKGVGGTCPLRQASS